MCLSNPQVPQAPKMPEPPPPPPMAVTPTTPTTVKPRQRTQGEVAQRSRGASMLSIPLSTGGAAPTGPVNLNIGK